MRKISLQFKIFFKKLCISALIAMILAVSFPFEIKINKETGRIEFKKQEARAADPNMILFWDGGAAPSGWSFVDDDANEAFYNDGTNNVFPRGNSSYGRMAGGGATHTHTATATSPSSGQSGGTSKKAGTTAGTGSRAAHTHAVSGTASLSPISNLPVYRNLRVIQYSGIPTTIPNGAIAIFDSTVANQMPNTDWDTYSGTQGTNYVSGFSTSGGTDGSNSHTGTGHTISGLTLDQETLTGTPGGASSGAVSNHTHTACSTGNTTDVPASSEPPYINVLLGKTNKDTTLPQKMIAMFDGSSFTSNGWQILSNTGGPFAVRFLKSATTYSAGSGTNPTHTHTAVVTCTSDGKSGTALYGTGTVGYGLSSTHTHTTTVTLTGDSGSTFPPYTDVVIAKKSYEYTTLTASDAPGLNDIVTVNSTVTNNSNTDLALTHIKYVIFIDTEPVTGIPAINDIYMTADCADDGIWNSMADYTWETSGKNVLKQGGQATDIKSCANTNFPDSTTYTVYAQWHASDDSIIYATAYVTFSSVPTLGFYLLILLVLIAIYITYKTGYLKLRRPVLALKTSSLALKKNILEVRDLGFGKNKVIDLKKRIKKK